MSHVEALARPEDHDAIIKAVNGLIDRVCRRLTDDPARLVERIASALKHLVPGIIAVQPQGGKLARAYAAQPRVEAGNVYLPNPRPHGRLIPERAWVDDFLHQLTAFPNGAHDDDVDAFTQLLVHWQKRLLRISWGTV